MKKIFLLLSAIVISTLSFAQAPQGINYQGVARDQHGNAISNTPITVQLTISQGAVVKYQETQNTQTDTFGLYSLVIGSPAATVQQGTFANIPWSGGGLSIQININGNMVATTTLQSVPYALYAGSAGNSSSGITTVTTNPANITSTVTSSTVSLDLATVGTATTVGSSTTIPQITVDQYGRVTNLQDITMPSPGVTTTVSVSLPLKMAGPVSSPSLSIPPADAANDGFLLSGDWSTFNNKVSSITGSAVNGILVTNTNTSYTVSADNASALWNANMIQSTPVLLGGMLPGQVLQYNGSGNWVNATIPLLPAPQQGSLLFTNSSNVWAPTNTSNIFTDGTRIGLGSNNPQGILDITNTNTVSATSAINITNGGQGYGINIQNTYTGAGSGGLNIYHQGLTSAAYISGQNNGNTADILYVETAGNGNAIKGYTAAQGNAIFGYNHSSASANSSAIYGFSDALGVAGTFNVNNPANSTAALIATTTGTTTSSYSGRFSGGQGLQTDKIQITNGAVNGYVLTTDASGNGTWQAPGSGSSAWTLNGNSLYPSNTSNFVGIGTTTPGSALEVQGGNSTAGTFVNSASGLPALSVQNSGTSGYALSVNNNGGGSGASISNTGNAPALVVNANATSGSPSGQFSGGSGLSTDNITNSNSITTTNLTVGNNIHISLNANANYVLTSDGTGNGTWQPIPGGVTSVTANTPLTSTGGSAPVLSLNSSGVFPGAYGSPTTVPTFTVDTYGRITNASTVAIPGLLPPGANGEMLWNNGGAWQPSNTANLFFNGAKMGIGNAAPVAYLDIATAGTSNALQSVTSGTVGSAGYFNSSNAANNSTALYVGANGLGNASVFQIANTNNSNAAISATTSGTGPAISASSVGGAGTPTLWSVNTGTVSGAGFFQTTAAGNGSNVLEATSSGTGNAVFGQQTGTAGIAGLFQVTNANNASAALASLNNGLGNAASLTINNTNNGSNALVVSTNGTGNALQAVNSGTVSSAGLFQITGGAGSAPAIQATTNSASGNSGVFSGGAGLKTDAFTMTNGAVNGALLMSNGAGNAMWSLNTSYAANAGTTSQPFTSAPATVNFGTINYNNGTGTNTGNSYTPSITGVFHIDAGLAVPTSTITITYGSISILVNGVVIKTVGYVFPQCTSGSVNATVDINADVNVPAGQAITIQLTTTPSVSSAATSAATSWFNVHLIR